MNQERRISMQHDSDPLAGLPALIRPPDVAALLDVSVQMLAEWRGTKTGPPYTKLTSGRNGAVRYPRERLRAYLEANTVDPQADPARYCPDCGEIGVTAEHAC